MRKINLAIILLGVSLSINAQNIFPEDGNVGIGITNPSEELQVIGNVKATYFIGNWNGKNLSSLIFNGYDTLNWDSAMYTNGIYRKWGGINNPFGGSHATIINIGQEDGSCYGFQISSNNNKGLKFRGFTNAGVFNEWYDIYHSGNFNKDILDSSVPNLAYNNINNYFDSDQTINGTIFVTGNVGIGTNDTKDYELGVKGRIAAEEIKVEVFPWSDFVFKSDYNLPTLHEVEKQIKENGHLTDIPNAKDVKENGIFLGEMNAKLLQKIEELTLYTIQQQKEIESLKKENKSLNNINKKLIELQERIEKLE